MRYRGNKICPDERTNKRGAFATISGGEDIINESTLDFEMLFILWTIIYSKA